jgi:hypothetical protein
MAKRSRPDDEGLFALPAGRRGRVESAVNASVRAARAAGQLGELDGALVVLARSQARSVDLAEAARDVWAHARAGGELRETLRRLRLDPMSRGANRDSLADFLRDLSRPEPATPDAAGPAEMGDPPHPG